MHKDSLITILALLVGMVWAAEAVSTIFHRDYAALAVVTPVMLAVTGSLFGFRVTKEMSS